MRVIVAVARDLMTAPHVLARELRLTLACLTHDEERRSRLELVEQVEIRAGEMIRSVVEGERHLPLFRGPALHEPRARDRPIDGILHQRFELSAKLGGGHGSKAYRESAMTTRRAQRCVRANFLAF